MGFILVAVVLLVRVIGMTVCTGFVIGDIVVLDSVVRGAVAKVVVRIVAFMILERTVEIDVVCEWPKVVVGSWLVVGAGTFTAADEVLFGTAVLVVKSKVVTNSGDVDVVIE